MKSKSCVKALDMEFILSIKCLSRSVDTSYPLFRLPERILGSQS